MKVYLDVHFYTKTQITGKQSKKLPKYAKNNNLLKTKRLLKTEI